MTVPDDILESALLARGAAPVAGVDEAGRGPLAGPVVAAAVIFDPARLPEGINDSKLLGPARRAALAAELRATAETGIGLATVAEIDAMNILRASHLAMVRAVAALPRPPAHVLVDGNQLPREAPWRGTPVVRGDTRCVSIAAASILAKVARDAIMEDLAQHFRGYGWETNRGYPSKRHKQALSDLGVTPHHRRSFRPVYQILYQQEKPRR